eukprot:s4280_g3.t1
MFQQLENWENQMLHVRCLLAPHAMSHGLPCPLRAARNVFVSQIEVNAPPKTDASLSEAKDAQAEVSEAQELDTFDTDVSHWAIFQEASQAKLSESEPTAATSQAGDHAGNENFENKCSLGLEAQMSSHGRIKRMVATDSLLPEKLLLFPYDILHRLHRSHLAQLDELWALRTLQQRRQLNVQKWTFLKDKLTETRAKAAELSICCSKMEESSSSLSRPQFGTRVKKLQRTTGVARDLALKCRVAQSRRDLLGRLARQLTSDAFLLGASAVLAIAFDVNGEMKEWNEVLSRSVREAVQREVPEVSNCCVSWDIDNDQLILYILNSPSNFENSESEHANFTINSDGTCRLVPVVEAAIMVELGKLELNLRVSPKASRRFNAAEIDTPLDLLSLGIQFHGLQGSTLTIDWVEPARWADVFGFKMDDVIIFANQRSTAEMTLSQIPHAEGGGLKLCVSRAV